MPLDQLFEWYDEALNNLVYVETTYNSALTFAQDGSDIAQLCSNALWAFANVSLPPPFVADVMMLMDYVSGCMTGDMRSLDYVSRARFL